MATIADIVNYTWKGQWLTSMAYVAYDCVYNDAGGYVCKLGHASGATDEPGTGANWTTYWDKMVQGFELDDTAGGTDGETLKPPTSNAFYDHCIDAAKHLNVLTERGSIIYRGAAAPTELLHGTSGQSLVSGGHGADVSWADRAKITFCDTNKFSTTIPWGAWTDLDLSSVIGAKSSLVALRVIITSTISNADQFLYKFRTNGDLNDINRGQSVIYIPGSGSVNRCYIWVKTDSSGIIEHGVPDYNGSGWTVSSSIDVIAYIQNG